MQVSSKLKQENKLEDALIFHLNFLFKGTSSKAQNFLLVAYEIHIILRAYSIFILVSYCHLKYMTNSAHSCK